MGLSGWSKAINSPRYMASCYRNPVLERDKRVTNDVAALDFQSQTGKIDSLDCTSRN